MTTLTRTLITTTLAFSATWLAAQSTSGSAGATTTTPAGASAPAANSTPAGPTPQPTTSAPVTSTAADAAAAANTSTVASTSPGPSAAQVASQPAGAENSAATVTTTPATSTVAPDRRNTTATVAPAAPGTINDPSSTVSGTINDPNARLINGPMTGPTATSGRAASTTAPTADAAPAPGAPDPLAGQPNPSAGVPSTASTLARPLDPTLWQTADASQRLVALSQLETELQRSQQQIPGLATVPEHASVAQRIEHAAAIQEVRAREAHLRSSLGLARTTISDQWSSASEQLAADYDAYVQALQRAQTTARAPAAE